MQIQYVVGDVLEGIGSEPTIVAHIVNRAGAWGRGFVLAVSKAWREPERRYRAWAHGYAVNDGSFIPLGAVQYIAVSDTITVANMVAQFGPGEGIYPPIRYDALRTCLEDLTARALRTKAITRMPRIGCGLAGGTWEEVEPLIVATLCAAGVPVYVYDLPARPAIKVEPTETTQESMW